MVETSVPSDNSPEDDEDDHLPAYWNRGEKKRAMAVVKALEDRGVVMHALKRTFQIVTATLAFIGTLKLAGLSSYWSAFVTWTSQK